MSCPSGPINASVSIVNGGVFDFPLIKFTLPQDLISNTEFSLITTQIINDKGQEVGSTISISRDVNSSHNYFISMNQPQVASWDLSKPYTVSITYTNSSGSKKCTYNITAPISTTTTTTTTTSTTTTSGPTTTTTTTGTTHRPRITSSYVDLPYPQPLGALEILPTVEANFEDPSFKLRENNTINNGISIIKSAKTKNDVNLQPYEITQVDDLGNVVDAGVGVISFLRPAYDPNKRTHVYKRAINLSNSDQVSYNDLTFGEYIHYISNPRGGGGLVDTSPYEVRTSVTISRNLSVATYSPY